MIINEANWQIAQTTNDKNIYIYHDGKLMKKLKASKENLNAIELKKILNAYQMAD